VVTAEHPRAPAQDAATFRQQRRGRNLALLGVLLFLVVLFFATTIVQMSR
jgi:hypothetical protein